jgi:hypothetical protein
VLSHSGQALPEINTSILVSFADTLCALIEKIIPDDPLRWKHSDVPPKFAFEFKDGITSGTRG